MDNFELKTYTHGPASGGEIKQLVLLFHGLGSDGRDLIGLAPFFAMALPDAIFVSPDAPFPCDMAPMGYQWFSLQDRDPQVMQAGMEKVAPLVDHFITQQIEKYGVTPAQTILSGFSQGAMVSLYAGPRYPEKLAAILAFSGAMIGADGLDASDIQKMPVHILHGSADDIVPVTAGQAARQTLADAGFTVSGGVVEGLGHSIDERAMDSAVRFLQSTMAGPA